MMWAILCYFEEAYYFNMYSSRSTSRASKERRDLINKEIDELRELLPLTKSTKGHLSYIQVMSAACAYIRKGNYFNKGKSSKYTPNFKWISWNRGSNHQIYSFITDKSNLTNIGLQLLIVYLNTFFHLWVVVVPL